MSDTRGFGVLQMESKLEELGKSLEKLSELPYNIVVDTASCYGNSEKEVGKLLVNYPLKFKISTKVGLDFSTKKIFVDDPLVLKSQIENSFKNLNTQKIEYLMLHRVDPRLDLETIGALYQVLVDYKREGRVTFIGISEPKYRVLKYLINNYGVDCVEIAYSAFVKPKVMSIINSNIQIIAYTSALRGFLNHSVLSLCDQTGTPLYNSQDLRDKLFTILNSSDEEKTVGFYMEEYIIQNVECVAKFIMLADELCLSPVILSLSYLSSLGVIAIPGTTKPERAVSNVVDIVKLDSTIIDKINDITKNFKGHPNPLLYDFLDFPDME